MGLIDRLSVFRQCVSDDERTLALDEDVELYDFCSEMTQLGPALPAPTATLPEDEE